jgi:hypothetical protein
MHQEAPGSRYYQQYAPGHPLWIARPNDLPGSDLTNAFIRQQPVGVPYPPAAAPPTVRQLDDAC